MNSLTTRKSLDVSTARCPKCCRTTPRGCGRTIAPRMLRSEQCRGLYGLTATGTTRGKPSQTRVHRPPLGTHRPPRQCACWHPPSKWQNRPGNSSSNLHSATRHWEAPALGHLHQSAPGHPQHASCHMALLPTQATQDSLFMGVDIPCCSSQVCNLLSRSPGGAWPCILLKPCCFSIHSMSLEKTSPE